MGCHLEMLAGLCDTSRPVEDYQAVKPAGTDTWSGPDDRELLEQSAAEQVQSRRVIGVS